MEFKKLLEDLNKKYKLEKIDEDRYKILHGNDSIEISPLMDVTADEIDKIFGISEDYVLGDFGNIGSDDLNPSFGIGNKLKIKRREPKGMFAGPNSELFNTKKQGKKSDNEDDEDSNPMVKKDPITPAKNWKKGFEPDPDHFKKDNGGTGFF